MLQYTTVGVLIDINVMKSVTHSKGDITIDCRIPKLNISYCDCYIVYVHTQRGDFPIGSIANFVR